MRTLMVGAGATGGYFGARLVQAGRDVTFLLREERAAQVREWGLSVLSPSGDFVVRPAVMTAQELRTRPDAFDLIVIATKSYQLEGAMDDIAAATGPHTTILPVLNGMRQLAMLDERFGTERVLGGLVRIVADLDAEGRVHQMTRLGELSFGERTGTRTPRIDAIRETLSGAGFEAVWQADIMAAMWQKWWILASIGAACLLGRGSTGQVATAPRGARLIHGIVDECILIAEKNGYPPDEAMLVSHRERLLEPDSPLTSSMYRDMTKGAPVEADHILGDLLERANGFAAPLLNAAYVQLKVYEATRVDRFA